MKKIILLILPFTMLISGSFVMAPGEPLIKSDTTLIPPTPPENGTYTHTGTLQTIIPTEATWYPYSPNSNQYGKTLTSGETYTVENKHFKGDSGYSKRPLTILGTSGTGQTLIVKGCKFTNIEERAIYVKNVDTVIVEGNYAEAVGGLINIYGAKDIKVRYNKVKNFGIMDVYGHFQHVIVVNDSLQVNSLDVSYNLVDDSNDPRYVPNMTDEQRHAIAFRADWMNFRRVQMADGKTAKVHHNILAGSEHVGEVGQGGGIILDHGCIGFDIEDNLIFNTTGTLISTANCKRVGIRRNIGAYSNTAANNLMVGAGTALTSANLASTKGDVYSLFFGTYISSHADDIAGQIPVNDIFSHVVENNRLTAYRVSGDRNSNAANLAVRDINKITDVNNNEIVLNNNSFTWKVTNSVRDTRHLVFSGVDRYDQYFVENLSVAAATPQELSQAIFGVDYGQPTTGNKMFQKWGTAVNNALYFDENRK